MKFLFSLVIVIVFACAAFAHGDRGRGGRDRHYGGPRHRDYHHYYQPRPYYSPYYNPYYRPYYYEPRQGFYYDGYRWGYYHSY